MTLRLIGNALRAKQPPWAVYRGDRFQNEGSDCEDSHHNRHQSGIEYPPFTLSTCPVTHSARSDARNATALAMSLGFPRRFNPLASGYWRMICSPCAAIHAAVASVSVVAGDTQFTVTHERPTSFASALLNPITPAFAIEYATRRGSPTRPASEMTLMILPQRRSNMPSATAREQFSTPYVISPIVRSHCSGPLPVKNPPVPGTASRALIAGIPALLTRISTDPNSSATRFTIAFTAGKSVTSAETPIA